MGLAIALVGMTSLAMAILLVPLLLRNRLIGSREAYNLAVYRDQLAEVERDIARGVLTADQAEAARGEIGRRILALAPGGGRETRPDSPVPFAIAVSSVVVLPFAAWTLYAQLGSPAVPDQPFAQRGANAPGTTAEAAAPHNMAEAITKLSARLREQPGDVNAWVLLARSQMSVSRYAEAADAYRHAVELAADRLDIVGDWGEAQVLAASGMVTPTAKEAFERTRNDPENEPRSRYYLALAERQAGNGKTALQAWVDLEADTPADADYLPLLRRRIEETATSLGVDPAGLKTSGGKDRPAVAAAPAARPAQAQAAPPAAAAPATAPATAPAPDPQRVRETERAMAGAAPEDKQAMINAMVERLAARLEQQPEDADGWNRLGRSYMVLNQPAKARDAFARAVKLKPDQLPLKEAYAEAIIAAAPDDATGPPPEAIAMFRQILQAQPKNQEALWYVGLAEATAGRSQSARELWTRLLGLLPANAPERRELEQRLAALKPDAGK